MPQEYSKEQFWKLYENLPQELKDVIFAEETGEHIYEVSVRHKITSKLSEIVELAGRVLIGLLPTEEFSDALQKEVNIKKDIAEKVAREINRFVFYPVKPALEQLHGASKPSQIPQVAVEKTDSVSQSPESTPRSPSKDLYRETLEEEE